jgi:glycosyltransferase involved in cell wall biosynthesis
VWEERADLYASAHCFALGARKASFSILLLEALAAGLRVAALPGEGTSRAGEHWSLAEMAESEAPDAYAAALQRALAPATPDTIARAHAMARRYDWSVMVPRIRRVYDEAIGAGCAGDQTIGSQRKNSAANIA